MIRNSSILFFESCGTATPIPWVNNAPDFSGFTDPTLSILQRTWQEFVAGGQELEIIPDPEPIDAVTQPDWSGFNLAFSLLPSLIQAEIVANQNHPSIVGKKDLAYSMISDHGVGAFGLIFPLFCQAGNVDQVVKEEWATLAESFNMPADFISIIRG